MRFTHIRRGEPPYSKYCGLETEGSISLEHYTSTQPAIVGQIRKLPEPICPRCIVTYEYEKRTR